MKRKPKKNAWTTPKPPRGKVYEWKVVKIVGEPVPQDTLTAYGDAGWRLVPKGRHKNLNVEHSGCRLMERSVLRHKAAYQKAVTAARQQQLDGLRGEFAEEVPGFKVMLNPPDLPYVLTEIGWMPTSQVRALEDERGRIDSILGKL